MTAFMNNDEIKLCSPACTAQISSFITIHVFVTVSNCTLVLHAKMVTFNQLVSIFIKRIGAKPVFKCTKHWLNLFKLFFCFIKIVVEYIIVQIELTLFALQCISEMNILAYIHRHIIQV